MTITIGSDPEVFLQSNGGEIISAIGRIGGSKDEPVRVTSGALQEDNVLAEFNTDPASTKEQFVGNVKSVMAQLRERVAPDSLAVVSSHEFTMQQLMRSGRAALMFGCEPDFNAYTGQQNDAPSAMAAKGLRTAGGHVHVGYDTPSAERNEEIGRILDVYLGIPSVLMDQDKLRRSLYGKAGAIRHKPYGVEYRTLSNFWLTHTDLIGWVYDRSVAAAGAEYDKFAASAEQIQACINESNERAAKHFIKQFKLVTPWS